MLKFKPKLIPTLFTIPALIVLLGLSGWQFKRLYWKENLINEITLQNKLEPIDIASLNEVDNIFYRQVRLEGEFLHAFEMHMYGGSRKFKGEPGYYIITPMRTIDNDIFLVNRGWVPEKLKEASKRPETLIEGQVKITGTIMPEEQRGLYVHDNQPSHNLWFYINLNEIRESTQIPLDNFYILAREEQNNFPIGRTLDPNIRNHHLGYALTWLFSALALIFIYIRFHKKDPDQ
jgi:surfeit locus 1 family protein